MRKVTQCKPCENHVQPEQQSHVSQPKQRPNPSRLLHAKGNGDADKDGQREKHRPNEANGPRRFHESPGIMGKAAGRKTKIPGK
jgi:hypothetical protein